MVGGFSFLMSGQLVVADTLIISAEVKFRLELAGSNPGVELLVNGLVSLGPLGSVKLVDSGFRINSQGLVARVALSLDLSFGHDIGLEFHVSALLSLNTTGRVQTLGSSSVDPGFRLHLEGSVEFLGFASASGFVDISIGPEGFILQFALDFELGGLSFGASGGAAVLTDGFAMKLNVHAVADAAVFSIDARGTIQINTTDRTVLGVAPNSFLLDVRGHIEILKILKFDAGLRVEVVDHEWSFRANASIDIFGIATLSGNIFLDSKGNFDVDLRGRMVIGSDSFGLVGEFHFRIRSEATEDAFGNSYYLFELTLGASVKVRAFGITLLGVGISASFTAEGAGRVPIKLDIAVSIDLGLFSITKHAKFTLGYLELPKPVYLGSASGDTDPANDLDDGSSNTPTWNGTDASPQPLYLNVGSRASLRNIAEGRERRAVRDRAAHRKREQRDGQGLRVRPLQHLQERLRDRRQLRQRRRPGADQGQRPAQGDHQRRLGRGRDRLRAAATRRRSCPAATTTTTSRLSGPRTSPSTATTAPTRCSTRAPRARPRSTAATATTSSPAARTRTSSTAVRRDDTINGPAGSVSGGSGDDYITLTLGPATTTIDGGADDDADTLVLFATNSNDTLEIKPGPASTDMTVVFNGSNRPFSNIEKLTLDGRGGADSFVVRDLTGSPLTDFTIVLGHTVTVNGTKNISQTVGDNTYNREVPNIIETPDRAGDSVLIQGADIADSFQISAAGADGQTGRYTQIEVTRTSASGTYAIVIAQSVRGEGDSLTIDALGGNDTLDAARARPRLRGAGHVADRPDRPDARRRRGQRPPDRHAVLRRALERLRLRHRHGRRGPRLLLRLRPRDADRLALGHGRHVHADLQRPDDRGDPVRRDGSPGRGRDRGAVERRRRPRQPDEHQPVHLGDHLHGRARDVRAGGRAADDGRGRRAHGRRGDGHRALHEHAAGRAHAPRAAPSRSRTRARRPRRCRSTRAPIGSGPRSRRSRTSTASRSSRAPPARTPGTSPSSRRRRGRRASPRSSPTARC